MRAFKGSMNFLGGNLHPTISAPKLSNGLADKSRPFVSLDRLV